MFGFLTEIVRLTPEQMTQLAATPRSCHVLAIVTNTLTREGPTLSATDPTRPRGEKPVLLLPGETSPPWAREITHQLGATIPGAEIGPLPGRATRRSMPRRT